MPSRVHAGGGRSQDTPRPSGTLHLDENGLRGLKRSVDDALEGMETGRFSHVAIYIPSYQLTVNEPGQDIQGRVGCEQILNALTPPYKRNPTSIAKALAEDGYAVFDGPRPAGDGLAGQQPLEKDGSDDTSSQP